MTIRHILCFGDSLTWGWVPVEEGTPSTRYAANERWTGVLAAALGGSWNVIEEGLSARTTAICDPNDPRLDGSAYLPAALASHMPLDLVIVMLGTNDTKSAYRRTAHDIALGMAKLESQIAKSAGGVGTAYPAPATLIVAPPPLGKISGWLGAQFEGAHAKAEALPEQYRALARARGAHFLSAGDHISTDGSDGVHFTLENNRILGHALAAKVREIVGTGHLTHK